MTERRSEPMLHRPEVFYSLTIRQCQSTIHPDEAMIAPCRKPACRLARLDGNPGGSDAASAAADSGAARELGVAEMCDVLQLPQSTVSRHLKVLLDSRWLQSRRRGTTRLYRPAAERIRAGRRPLWTLAREQSDAGRRLGRIIRG